jgi:protein-tyrosine phosphatase
MYSREETQQRHLNIDGTYNVRDLGGYRTTAGHLTRWHTLVRADKLNRISPTGQKCLQDYGIHSVIDLRYSPEVASEPDVFANDGVIHYRHMPLYELSGDGTLPVVPYDLKDLYRMILDHRQEQIRSIISELLLPGRLPAIVHCTAGKDRTGIIVALLLGAVDVPHEVIVEDYALSDQYLRILNSELRQQAISNGYDAEWFDRLLQCQPETMQDTLSHLDDKYGGIKDYLLQCGITANQFRQLHVSLVDK